MWPKLIEKHPKLDHVPDFHQILGLTKNATQEEVDAAYAEFLKKDSSYSVEAHLAWKVLRDRLYSKLYEEGHSLEELYDAGFFVDKISLSDSKTVEFTPGWMTTPIHKIQSNLAHSDPNKPHAILITTGGFSPVHHGHLAMMERAKHELTDRGYEVVGGYFSPSHDDYVSTKYGGEAELGCNHRIYLTQLALQGSDWLMVDPWESRYVKTDINFTDVIERLDKYINYFVKPEKVIEIFYVFGGDNVKFAKVFKQNYGCICIERSQPLPVEIQEEPGIKDNQRIIFIKNSEGFAAASSTTARKWQASLMPEEVSDVYFRWRKNALSAESENVRPRKLYILRDEDTWAISTWMEKFGHATVLEAKDTFTASLVQVIKDVFQNVLSPDLSIDVDVRTYHLDEQQDFVYKLERNEKVLNLDVCTNRKTDINVSRLFNVCDGQIRSKKLVGRPGYPDIETQISGIQEGEYTLVDDDIASGGTMNMLLGLLPEKVTVTKIRSLINNSRMIYQHKNPGMVNLDAFDEVDLRDFMLGSQASGLVIALKNEELARAPYLQPYVSLITRASIPPSTEMIFSKKLWELNLKLFEDMGGKAVIEDLDVYTQKFFYSLGFKPEMKVTDLCAWHIQMLGS